MQINQQEKRLRASLTPLQGEPWLVGGHSMHDPNMQNPFDHLVSGSSWFSCFADQQQPHWAHQTK